MRSIESTASDIFKMEAIPFIDLRRQYELIRLEVDEAVARVLSKGNFILGEEVASFENEFAEYCGAAHCIGVASGTDALLLALLACDIRPGDEVVTAPNTPAAAMVAIEQAGACPVLVDIDAERHTLDPSAFARAVSSRTRAVIPVHLYGCPAEMDPILEYARGKGIRVVEDCAQAHGARYHGQRVGTLGDIAAFSFYPTKNIGAYGDGGAVVTDDPELAERVRLLRQYGWEERYISSIRGINSRLDELQAGILRVKLRHLDEWNRRRRELARTYSSLLADTDLALPLEPPDMTHVYHQFVIRHPRRRELQACLKQRGISTLVHYPVPIHLQPTYRHLAPAAGSLSRAEQAAQEVLSLPLYPEMPETDLHRVSDTILDFFKNIDTSAG